MTSIGRDVLSLDRFNQSPFDPLASSGRSFIQASDQFRMVVVCDILNPLSRTEASNEDGLDGKRLKCYLSGTESILRKEVMQWDQFSIDATVAYDRIIEFGHIIRQYIDRYPNMRCKTNCIGLSFLFPKRGILQRRNLVIVNLFSPPLPLVPGVRDTTKVVLAMGFVTAVERISKVYKTQLVYKGGKLSYRVVREPKYFRLFSNNCPEEKNRLFIARKALFPVEYYREQDWYRVLADRTNHVRYINVFSNYQTLLYDYFNNSSGTIFLIRKVAVEFLLMNFSTGIAYNVWTQLPPGILSHTLNDASWRHLSFLEALES